jgi:hypothetical protein
MTSTHPHPSRGRRGLTLLLVAALGGCVWPQV